ncbi:MAG: alanine racemase [Ardenticatenaceae bacterium]
MNLTIEKPTFIIDKAKAIRNIDKMVSKAQENGVRLRPHFKTHQSAQVGEWFRERGVDTITASSVDMAVYFAEHGWQDITIAFPVNLLQIKALNELAQQVTLNLLVESVETAQRLSDSLDTDVQVYIKIDVGSNRTGRPWHDLDGITALAHAIQDAPNLSLVGLLSHAGHTYRARSKAQVVAIYDETVSRVQAVQAHLRTQAIETVISVGDTPASSVADSYGAVDEIRPGNFVYYDLMQLQIGACTEEEIAVAAACPVVAKHKTRGQLILYGGAVHLSKEALKLSDGRTVYGQIALGGENGWGSLIDNAYVVGLSQEHGIVQADQALIERVQVGDLLFVLPVHSCLTANLMRHNQTLDGEMIEMMPI